MSELSFAGKTVVITGAGSGLSQGIARRFSDAGARIVIAGLDAVGGARSVDALQRGGAVASYEALDVRDPAQSRALVEKLTTAFDSLDVWVNNAAVVHHAPAETLDPAQWDESLGVLLSGAFYCAQAVGQYMLRRGQGVIVNVASVDGYQAVEGRVATSTAMAGLVMLTQALGIEWARHGVRVTGVAPGVVVAPSQPGHGAASLEGMDVSPNRIPLRRPGTPDEIAEAVFYLASPEAAYVVGETLRVDGGWTAYQLF